MAKAVEASSLLQRHAPKGRRRGEFAPGLEDGVGVLFDLTGISSHDSIVS